MKKIFMVLGFLVLFLSSLSARYIFDGKIIFSKHATNKDSLAYLIIEKASGVLDTFAIIDTSGNVYWKYPLRIADATDTLYIKPNEMFSKLGLFTQVVCTTIVMQWNDDGYFASKGWNFYLDYDDDDRYAKIWFHGTSHEALVADSVGEILEWTGKGGFKATQLRLIKDVSQITDTLAHIQADTSGIDRNVTGLLINGESINNASDFAIKTEDKDGNILFSVKGDGVIEGYNLNKQFAYQCAGDIFNIAPNTVALLGWITPATTEQDLSPHNNDFDYHNFAISDRIAKGLVWKLIFPTDPADGYLHALDSDDFYFDDAGGANGFTMGGWCEVVASSDTQTIWSKWDETTALPLREWRMYIGADEKLVMMLWDESVDADPYRTSDAAISTGWHLMLAVYSGAGGGGAATGITLYVDGVVEASTAYNDISYVGMENTNTYVFVGAIEGPAGTNKDHWQGDMGHQFITTDQLTADEAWELYLRTRGYYNE